MPRVFDADTHVSPSISVVQNYLSKQDLEKLEQYAPWKMTNHSGNVVYQIGQRSYKRRLGDAGPNEAAKDPHAVKAFSSVTRDREPAEGIELDPSLRIQDMDIEGVDVNLMIPSGTFGSWSAIDDIAFEQAMYAAYHRWMQEYCAAYPSRLNGLLLVSSRDLPASLKQIEQYGPDRWPLGVFLYAPATMPLDHPDLEPLWSAAEAWNLAVILHTFSVNPPYTAGGLDTWDNHFLQRAAAHPWSGMRNMAALMCGGVLDRHPGLRIGVLEAGHGWLPGWIKRLDAQLHLDPSALPPLKMLPSEYVRSGQYFHSIEMSEGKEMTEAVIDLVGDSVLMYASDYPHGESMFPHSVETVRNWSFAPDIAEKLFWGNATRFYGRYSEETAATTAS